MIGADLYEADLREGSIAEKDKLGNLRILQHDLGPSELLSVMLNSANLERAKLAGAQAMQADFSDAMMKGCRLARANLARPSSPAPIWRMPVCPVAALPAPTCPVRCWWERAWNWPCSTAPT